MRHWEKILGLLLWVGFLPHLALAESSADPGLPDNAVSFPLSNPVAEIMILPPGGTIPASVYQKYPAKQIALTIVYKKWLEEEKAVGEKAKDSSYDYFGGSEIQLSFHEKNIRSIARRGFLSSYQVKDTTEKYRRMRFQQEDRFLGYHLDAAFPPTHSVEVRPKSAYLSLAAGAAEKNPMARKDADPKGLLLGYGNILAVLKDDVKSWATFTMGDSLSTQVKSDVRTLRFRSDSPLPMLTFNSYIEAQVWGPLSLRDVKHFIVNCDKSLSPVTKKPEGKISEPGLFELRRLQLPIFDCEEERVAGRLIRVKAGKLIYSPGPPMPEKPLQGSNGDAEIPDSVKGAE